jgi:tRNA A-37 threonylcarbamoyl transferase component Bud32
MNATLCRLTIGEISWLTSDADRDCITEVIQALQNGGEVLRATPHRRVLRVGGCRPLIVKHFAPQGPTAKLKALFRRSPAVREWLALRRADGLGLPVPRAVALGWRREGLQRESFLVTEAVNDGIAVSACLFGKGRLPAFKRCQVVRAAALVIRRMHEAGTFHKDLHLDNLIASSIHGSPTVHLIDFQRVAFYRSLKPCLRRLNLAMLNGGCVEATHTDRLRFLKSYFSDNSTCAGDWRALAARLETMGQRHRRRIWRSRRRRCLAENRDFTKIHLGNFVGVARRDQYDGFEDVWREPAHRFSRSVIVARSHERTLARVNTADRAFYVARYHQSGFARVIGNLCGASAARRAWLAGNSAAMAGIPLATPVAWLEWWRGPWLLDSYVVSGSEKGTDLAETLIGYAGDFQAKRRLIEDFARYIARLHGCDLAIRHLTGKEVIVGRKNSRFVFALVDFSGLICRLLSRQSCIEQLDALAQTFGESAAITKTDRLRFLKAYLARQFGNEWKRFNRGAPA